jgi:hypothetical protein
MSPSAQLISEQLKEIIEDEKKTDKGAREVQEQVDGEEDLDLDNTSSVLNTVLNTINNKFEHECFVTGILKPFSTLLILQRYVLSVKP